MDSDSKMAYCIRINRLICSIFRDYVFHLKYSFCMLFSTALQDVIHSWLWYLFCRAIINLVVIAFRRIVNDVTLTSPDYAVNFF
jgi:hypothetical protein